MDQTDFVRFVLDALDRLQIEYAIVGSFASIAYGEPRYTQDIDILVRLDLSRASALCQQFPVPDWYVSEPTVRDAVQRRRQFNVIHTLSGNKVDFIVARDDDWGRLQFERRVKVGVLADRMGYTVHPEDVILGKLQFYRDGRSEKHLRDIAGMLLTSADRIDRARVAEWAATLNVLDEWLEITTRVDASQ